MRIFFIIWKKNEKRGKEEGSDMKDKLYKLMNWPEIEAIIYSEEDNPHRLLGPLAAGNAIVFQAFWPDSQKVELVFPDTGKEVEM